MREWYFVQAIEPGRYQVQVLDEDGAAVGIADFFDESSLVINGKVIPVAVLIAAKSCVPNHGQYVSPDGQLLDLWGNPQAA